MPSRDSGDSRAPIRKGGYTVKGIRSYTVAALLGAACADMIAKTGIRVLDMGWFFGARHIATKDFAVTKPADLKGRKIRMQPTAIYVDAMTAMGANVIPMDFKEVYTGLQTGVISGLDNPANVYAARSRWEVIN